MTPHRLEFRADTSIFGFVRNKNTVTSQSLQAFCYC